MNAGNESLSDPEAHHREDDERRYPSRRRVRPQREQERKCEGRQPQEEPDQSEIGGGLDVGVLDAPLVLARRKRER